MNFLHLTFLKSGDFLQGWLYQFQAIEQKVIRDITTPPMKLSKFILPLENLNSSSIHWQRKINLNRRRLFACRISTSAAAFVDSTPVVQHEVDCSSLNKVMYTCILQRLAWYSMFLLLAVLLHQNTIIVMFAICQFVKHKRLDGFRNII